jgi:Na+/melibiose symporter-like transporter
MTNDPMMEDRELDLWREQWSSVARPSPEFQRQVQKRIKLQDRRFLLGNLLTAAVFVGMLIFAVYLSHQGSWLGKGWATGVCVLVFVSVAYRLWILRGTWRAETQSTRAFVELWHRRALARIRLLRISIYVSIGWIMFCAALTTANWAIIKLDVMDHPTDWLELMVATVLMQPVIWLGAIWLRRRKVAELNKVTRLLEEIRTMSD